MDGVEAFILFGDINSVVFWHCTADFRSYLERKCAECGLEMLDMSTSITQLFGHLVNVEAQYDTKQNNLDLICCDNGFTIKMRHLGLYSLLVISKTKEASHLLYMADLFRAIAQLFVGYSYGSLASKSDMLYCIPEMLSYNSLTTNDIPFQFLRACEIIPQSCSAEISADVTKCLELLVSSTTAASILDGFGTVLEAHCFANNVLVGSIRCAPQTTRQRILPSELWKLRDLANLIKADSPRTVNVFLNSCESPYFLACRTHFISLDKDFVCILLCEHDWASIARPVRRLLKLLSMILRGQPAVLRLTPRHLDTIAMTELNRMSDCLDEFWREENSQNDKKSESGSLTASDKLASGSTGSGVNSSSVFPSGLRMLPPLSGIRALMNRALNQFRTLRTNNAFHSFCRDPRNPAHHSTVKQLYSNIEQLHNSLFQPLNSIPTPSILADPLVKAAKELSMIFSKKLPFGPSLPIDSSPDLTSLLLCVLVDRSSNTFAAYPNMRMDPSTRLLFRDGALTTTFHELVKCMENCMWKCWPLIGCGHSGVNWVSEFTFEHGITASICFAYASHVAVVPASKIIEKPQKEPLVQAEKGTLPSGDTSHFDQIFNDPDITQQLVWNEHFYRLLARIYGDSSIRDSELEANRNNNMFSLDFNATMRSRQSLQLGGAKSERSVTVIYEAFCLFLEPVTSSDVERVFQHLFSDEIKVFAECDRFFPVASR